MPGCPKKAEMPMILGHQIWDSGNRPLTGSCIVENLDTVDTETSMEYGRYSRLNLWVPSNNSVAFYYLRLFVLTGHFRGQWTTEDKWTMKKTSAFKIAVDTSAATVGQLEKF